MYRLASADAFPGVDLSRTNRVTKLFAWLPRLFQCRSTHPEAWIAGIRTQTLDTYKALNKAVSKYSNFLLCRWVHMLTKQTV